MDRNKTKKRKMSSGVTVCNICKYPADITYTETDPDTGEINTKTHRVQCLGHSHIHPALWNNHPLYDKFRKHRVKQKKESASKK